MCRPVQCMVCNKTTWAGCGAHVAPVKAMVPPEKWCTCTDEAKADAAKSQPSLWDNIKRSFGGS